ncbi:hypothetical protein V1509DRAFT_629034, partial [Lipomyces kononenkoae]
MFSKRFALIVVVLMTYVTSSACLDNTVLWLSDESQQMNEFMDCLELSGYRYKYSLTEPYNMYFCQMNGDGPEQVTQSNMTWVSYCMSHVGARFGITFVTCDEDELKIATYVPRDELITWANDIGYPVRAEYQTGIATIIRGHI